MEAIKEITGGMFQPHIYLLDGNTLIAYIKNGTKDPFYFKNGIRGFSKSGRKFVKQSINLFPKSNSNTNLIEVKGSKGDSYFVDKVEMKCTCPGFTYRGECKHIKIALSS